jgi:hypothetical protein
VQLVLLFSEEHMNVKIQQPQELLDAIPFQENNNPKICVLNHCMGVENALETLYAQLELVLDLLLEQDVLLLLNVHMVFGVQISTKPASLNPSREAIVS